MIRLGDRLIVSVGLVESSKWWNSTSWIMIMIVLSKKKLSSFCDDGSVGRDFNGRNL